MVIRLDPQQTLLWRTPDSIQFGVDRPSVILDTVSAGDEQIIAALVTGVSRSGLTMIGRLNGFDDISLQSLLSRLEPALIRTGDAIMSSHPLRLPASTYPCASDSIVVSGSGETARILRTLLATAGASIITEANCTTPNAGDAETNGSDQIRADLAILVAHFVLEPEEHGRWLRSDTPHLAVVFGDRVVRIGPLITPGHGPCLFCFELYARDEDPARPALAAQLWGRQSAAESTLVAMEVATLVTRIVTNRAMTDEQSRRDPLGVSLDLDIVTGETSARIWSTHPECQCRGIGASPEL